MSSFPALVQLIRGGMQVKIHRKDVQEIYIGKM